MSTRSGGQSYPGSQGAEQAAAVRVKRLVGSLLRDPWILVSVQGIVGLNSATRCSVCLFLGTH